MAESEEEKERFFMKVKEESEKAGWINHKLKSRLLGEKLTMSDMQMIPP